MKYLKSKKVLTAFLTGVAVTVANLTGNPGLQDAIMLIGLTLIGGIGMADFGKEAKALEGPK